MKDDLKEFLKDFSKGDGTAIAMKTGAFLKRNWLSFKKKCGHIGHEIKKIVQGFKAFKQDLKYYFTETKDHTLIKYKRHSFKSDEQLRRIKQDFIKFIPFSFFIIIPGLEFLLPAWLVIFPNAIPS